ncbi:EamA family transporter [Candidatus Thorarchaeota archaeon]|nr:MAG: EamA family transporter [Candidatus Thorarchaeota archaeon]
MQASLGPYIIGILSALAATALFGVTNVIYRKIDNEISVLDIAITRIWISLPLSFLFTVTAVGSVSFTVPAESMFPLAISMIIGIMIGDTMYFLSQERIGVARAFPITMSYPFVVYLMAAIFLEEPVLLQRIIGTVAVVLGVMVIARAKQSEESKEIERWNIRDRRIGFALAFLTILAWAASDVIFQFGLISVEAADANFFRILVASVIFIPVFMVSLRGGRRLPTRRISVIAIVTGLFGMGFSLIAYSYAVKLVGATVTSILIASAPMITAPLSAVYLNEDVNKYVAFGTLLTIIGILLVIIIK